jgi:hypothetical protein
MPQSGTDWSERLTLSSQSKQAWCTLGQWLADTIGRELDAEALLREALGPLDSEDVLVAKTASRHVPES